MATQSKHTFAKALVAIVAGIVTTEFVALPLALLIPLLALMLGVVWWVKGPMAQLAVAVMLLLVGITSARISTRNGMPTDDEMLIEIERITSTSHGKTLGEAHIHAHRSDQQWINRNVAVRFRCDSSLDPQEGEMIVAIPYTKSYEPTSDNRFEQSMARQGFAGEVFITHDNIISRSHSRLSAGNWLRAYATKKIEMLDLPQSSRGIVEAMSIARREHLPQTTREEFARSGLSHLLAVSGLHISFIFGIAALLFRFLVLFKRGQLWLAAAIITTIWCYAIMAGMTPSVMRATVMFTIFQLLATLSRRGYSSENLALTATIMLIVDSHTLYDVGFQLSFIAVAAIIVWGTSWSRLLGNSSTNEEPHNAPLIACIARRALHWLWASFAISLAASIAVLPLTAYHFGTISLWSIVTSPLMVLVGGFIVITTFIWLLLPIPYLAPLLGWVLEGATYLMSEVAHLCSTHALLTAELRMSGVAVAMSYLIMATLTIMAQKNRSHRSDNRQPRI